MKKIVFLILGLSLVLLILKQEKVFYKKPTYYLSIGAIFRNEARFLKEWIEFHRMMGVEHFYLYNNLSEDNYRKVLDPYIAKGIVELWDWPYQGSQVEEWNKIQCNAYTDMVEKKRHETFWLAIIDTDEFILPANNNLAKFLRDYEEYAGIGINWQLYGTSGVKKIEKTLLGSLTKKAPQDFPTNCYVKSIVQPKKVKKFSQPHYAKYKKPFFHVTEKQEPFASVSITPTVSIEKIRINHYTYRDEEFYWEEKCRRYRNWHPDKPLPEMNPLYNAEEDAIMQTHLPELERRLLTLL